MTVGTFDAVTHVYRLGGVVVPGTTTIIDRAGLIDSEWFTEAAREVGTMLHRACTAIDLDVFDAATCPAVILGRVRAYQRFLDEVRPRWGVVEQPRVCPRRRFGGTVDRIGVVPGHGECIVDLKAGVPADWHRLQTAAYAVLFDRPTARRFTLYLRDNGGYTFHRHPHAGDLGEFLALPRVGLV